MDNDRIKGAGKYLEGSAEDTFGNVIGSIDHEAKGKAKKVIGGTQNILGKAKDCVSNSVDSAQNHIHEKPVQSTLLALGIGLVLGKLFSL